MSDERENVDRWDGGPSGDEEVCRKCGEPSGVHVVGERCPPPEYFALRRTANGEPPVGEL